MLGQPQGTRGGFAARGRNASATGGDGKDRLIIAVDGYKLDLSLKATRPPVFLFGNGYLNAYCNTSYFYTRPRMDVAGTLQHSGPPVPVTGTAIFDRNWGFDPAQEIAGWDWMNFQLDDGRDIAVVVISLLNGNTTITLRTGVISDQHGNEVHLHPGDFTATPTRYWQRDATCRYPVDWDVTIKGLTLHAHALLDRTEMRSLRSPLTYALWPGWPLIWDGPTAITGDTTGQGWNDLGHYCLA
jgi:predicted secreted hydrolase